MVRKNVILMLSLIIVIAVMMGATGSAYAIGSAGSACFRDDLGGVWTIDYFDYGTGTSNLGISGNRVANNESCNNSNVQPVVGTANFLSNGITILGLQTLINDPGRCTNVTWSVPAVQAIGAGTGGWRNQLGTEGKFSFWAVDCASGLPLTPPMKTVSVSIGDNFFSPQSVTVNVGDTVTWTNNGNAVHNSVNSGTFPWNSGTLSSGQSYSVTFMQAGTFSYSCTIHGFNGTVIVH